MLPIRFFRSEKLSARHSIAIISEAGVMLKPSSRGTPWVAPPKPTTIWRSARSFISITRFQTTVRGSMPIECVLLWILLSMTAANRLLAFSIAEKSPVKCKLMSSIGTTCEYPPPAAPPLIPKTGPNDGSRNTAIAFLPILLSPSVRPMLTVVLPSPAGVGVIAVTSTNLLFFIFSASMRCNGSFALYFP